MTKVESTTSDAAVRFPSLTSLRAAHSKLLKRFRTSGLLPETITEVEAFIRLGKATGALLDKDSDRWAAQSQLDYWATQLYKSDHEPPDATLDDFDPQLAPEIHDSLCPYMGLDSFHETKQSVFFGRGRLVSELVDKLRTSHFLAVLGSSGSGKSSLVRAGLIASLKKGRLTGSENWIYCEPIVPGSDPLANLARLIMPANADAGSIESTTNGFRQESDYLARLVSERFNESVVLVIDQFEEVFTLCTDEIARNGFVDNLIGLCMLPDSQHRVIITMRSDFESNVARLPHLQLAFEQNEVRITSFSASELREIIEAPAALIGLKFEDGVVDALLNDILGEPAALPLLQFTLLKLWENRERNRITWEAYKKLGGGRQALARSADKFYNGLIHEDQVTMRRILLKMVRPGEGLEVTSNRIQRAVLYQKAEARDRIDRVLDKLIKERLVRISEGDSTADEQIEIAHEALIRNWPRLVEWLEEDRVALRQRQRLTTAAEEWQRLNHATSALWRRELLEEARRYDDLNDLERRFVNASNARQQRVRIAWVAGILVTITYLVITIFVYRDQRNDMAQLLQISNQNASTAQAASTSAVAQQMSAEENAKEAKRQADLALASRLASQAQLLIETRKSKQTTAVLLAVRSMQLDPSIEAAQILRNNTLASPIASMTHDDVVHSIAFSPDGQYMVSGSTDNTARVWETATGKEISRMTHDGAVYSVTFSPDGQYVVSGSIDNTARVWEAATGNEIARMTHDDWVNSIAFSPDGQYVVSGGCEVLEENEEERICSQGTSRVWEATTGNEIARMTHDGDVTSVAFSPDGQYVVSGSTDNIALVWDVFTENEVSSMTHDGAVWSVAFSPNGQYVVSGSDDGTARVWEAATGKEVARTTHDDFVESVAFSSDGQYVVSGSFDGTARVWEATTGKELARMAHDDAIWSVAFSPNGQYVVSGSNDGTARVWEATTGNEIARMTHDDDITSVAFSPNGQYVVSGSYDNTARVWEAATGKEVARMTHDGAVWSVAFSPNGQYVVSSSDDGTVRVWKIATGNEVVRMTHDDFVESVAFSSDGQYVVSGSYDGTARVWEATTGKEVARMAHDDAIWSVAFSPDGQYVASGGCDVLEENEDQYICLQGITRLWEAFTGNEVVHMSHNDWVNSIVFSPDGKYVASGSDDGTARVWEATTGNEIARMTHDDAVWSVAFSPDGQYVVSGSNDGTARVWEAVTGKEVARTTHDDFVESVAFSPDGQYVVSGSFDGTARVWIWRAEDYVASACLHLTRNLTFDEWKQYFGDRPYQATCSNLPTHSTVIANAVLQILSDPNIKNRAQTAINKANEMLKVNSHNEDTVNQASELVKDVIAQQISEISKLDAESINQYLSLLEEAKYMGLKIQIDPRILTAVIQEVLEDPKDLNRVQTAISKVSDILRKWSSSKNPEDEAKEIVKAVIEEQISEISKLDAESINQNLSLLEAAKDVGLKIQIDPRILTAVAQEALEDPKDLNRVQTAITKVGDILRKISSSSDTDDQANEIVRVALENLILESNWKTGDITYYFSLLDDAKTIELKITSASRLNHICWHGSIRGFAKEVLQYCEQAVDLAPDNGAIRDSRGLARALTGDTAGAIDDFQFYIDSEGSYYEQRQQWIIDLKAGKDPFTPEVLEILKGQ